MEIDRILVPLDFSTHSERALETAMALAKARGAAVDLVHAYHLPVTVATPDQVVIPEDFWASVRNAAREKLEEAAERVRGEGLSAETHLTERAPAAAIVDVAEQVAAGLIVMGSRGNTGLRHVLLGSVAERTLRTAPCPVLTVKDKFEAGAAYERILVPVDFSPSSLAAIAVAASFAKEVGDARLVLVHASFVPVEIEALVGSSAWTPMGDVESKADEDLRRLAGDLEKDGLVVETLTRRGSPESVILKAALERSADLIVMGTHGRTGLAHVFLGSVAERVVREAECPVLTTRTDAT